MYAIADIGPNVISLVPLAEKKESGTMLDLGIKFSEISVITLFTFISISLDESVIERKRLLTAP
jgi:hypothetical protein